MAVSEDLLWDSADKSKRMIPRLRRMAVMAGFLVVFGLALLADSDLRLAVYTAVAYVLVEIAYLVWDWRRLVEVGIVVDEAGGLARLRLRRASGRITECDPRRVARVLVIHDNVVDSAKLRLSLRRRPLSFARPGRAPVLTAWQELCPQAEVEGRHAWWGMPGVPD